jgi:photosystem II stability/assembly factor-like uncharacterized protein
MVKIILVLISLSFLTNIAFSQSGWENMLITNDPTTYTSINFIDQNTGWAVGWFPGFSAGCRIAMSTNGGVNWECQLSDPYPALFDVHFLNSATGYAAGWQFWKTTNGGNVWSAISTPAGSINSIFFINENTGFAAGSRAVSGNSLGTLFRTTSGGSNWDTVSVLSSTSINEVFFINSTTGWFCGNNGVLLKATNALNFTFSNSGTTNDLKSMFFLNEQTGWTGGNGLLLKTTNGGVNWSNQIQGFGLRVNSIQFINANVGWISGDSLAGVKVYHTTNGGNSWNQQFVAGGVNPKIFFIDANTGWFVGGVNRKTTNGGVTSLTPISTYIPSHFSLSQNFPNPFNPATKIKFDIPASVETTRWVVSLKIHDILGREVAVLVNEQLRPGSYEVDWDASAFPSGIYFYTINSGSFKETRKMVLLK